uniref:Protein kinase domain-containing protein n=2 Tax=Guillardia theta TaxID=55529 RepID=A0A7S4HAD9_GUITH
MAKTALRQATRLSKEKATSGETPTEGTSSIDHGAPLMEQLKNITELMATHRESKMSLNGSMTKDLQKRFDAERDALDRTSDKVVEAFKARMEQILEWRAQMADMNISGSSADTSGNLTVDPTKDSSDMTPPEHSKGGFACVLMDRENKVAFRLEPMRSSLDAAAWLAFHLVLDMFGMKAANAVKEDKPPPVFREDRGMSVNVPVQVWNQTSIVRCYQEPTVEAFSKHVVKQRNRLLRKAREKPSQNGGILISSSIEERRNSMILMPLLWFWHTIYMEPVPENENQSLTENDWTRRIKGRELADVLCNPDSKGTGAQGQEGYRNVRLLCSVFELAEGDLGSTARSKWRAGAPRNIAIKVLEDIGKSLRCMHACGVAHGDVKMANILNVGDEYWLGDLPALTRATTKMLTVDPVVSTRIMTGRRMMSNDMWGLGLVTLTLLSGSSRFRKVCDKFKSIIDPKDSGPLWMIFAAGFVTSLFNLSRRSLPGDTEREQHLYKIGSSLRELVSSPTGRSMIKMLSREHRESARAHGEALAKTVLQHEDFPRVWKQLVYCMDVSNIARNALAMPLPSEMEEKAPSQ